MNAESYTVFDCDSPTQKEKMLAEQTTSDVWAKSFKSAIIEKQASTTDKYLHSGIKKSTKKTEENSLKNTFFVVEAL
ncbi:MAG: hypothetical protein EAZ92_08715 [Candidatus Kapaibacterium sp.]|nr:MAG: hypothetical protein EAZ92_08715 [Candidatus Kapabacteria bacterium]